MLSRISPNGTGCHSPQTPKAAKKAPCRAFLRSAYSGQRLNSAEVFVPAEATEVEETSVY